MLRVARRVHPVPRVVEALTQGISSKSSRTRVESIEALCEILAEEGLAVFDRTREKPFPAIAQVRGLPLCWEDAGAYCHHRLLLCAEAGTAP